MSAAPRPVDGFALFDVSVVLIFIVLAAVCATSPAVGHRTDIVLGRRLGPVSYGEPQRRITRVLGRGLRAVMGVNGFRSYPASHIFVAYPPIYVDGGTFRPNVERHTAAIVMTRSTEYKTESGLGVGSSLQLVQRQIPQADCSIATGMSTPTKCRYENSAATTVFNINPRTKRVTQVAIIPPGE
jgi:hypothetical protein